MFYYFQLFNEFLENDDEDIDDDDEDNDMR